MDKDELLELFYNRTYEKFVNKKILDDKNYIVPRQQLLNYVHELIDIPYTEYIEYIKKDYDDIIIEAADITQFSSFSACEIDMCNALIWANNPGCQFVDVGRFFPESVSSRTDAAYKKYGENHIKTANQLGLTFEYYEYWYLSCIGYIYPELEEQERKHLLARTITRNNLYRQMLVDIIDHDINPDVYMNMLSENTMKRRLGNVCTLFDICIEECNYYGIIIHCLLRKTANIVTSTLKNTQNDIFSSYESCESINENRRDLFLLSIRKNEVLSDEEEIILFQRYNFHGDQEAYNRLANSFLWLVVSISKQYKVKGISFEELIQEGTLGLMEAIKHFDYIRGIPFSKYAQFWIRQSIFQAANYLPYHVKIPVNQIRLYKKVRQEIYKYEKINGYKPPISEIEIDEEVDFSDLSYLIKLPEDLSKITSNKEDWDDCPCNEYKPDNSLDKESDIINLTSVMSILLNKKEIDILRAMWGLDNDVESLSRIAERFNLTRERIRQIAWKAMSKLRESNIFKKLFCSEGKKVFFISKEDEEKRNVIGAECKNEEGTLLLAEIANDFNNFNVVERLSVNSSRKWDRDLYKTPPKKVLEKKDTNEENQEMNESCEKIIDNNVINVNTVGTEEAISNDEVFLDDSNLSKDIIYSVYRNTTSTYKYYWLISILQLFQKSNNTQLYICDILARMVANAWYPINCHYVSFGSNDSLSNIISVIKDNFNFPDYADLEFIYNEIKTNIEDKCIKNQLQRLIKYVPYRFLSPWIKNNSIEDCVTLSQQYKGDCLYALLIKTEKPFIIINPSWENFLREHNDELIDFSFDELSRFLQYRNPSIKDIRDKIECSPNSQDYINETTNDPAIDNTIETSGNFSYIYNHERKILYSSSGRILKNANSFYRINFTYSNISINIIDKTDNGRYVTGKRIINAGYRSLLYKKIDKSDYIDKIEEIKQNDGKWCIKVNGVWYGDYGGIVTLNKPQVGSEVHSNNVKVKISDSLEKTLIFFQEGCSPEEISSTRQLALSTIYGHLAQLVKYGLISAYDVISEKDVSLVRNAIEYVGDNQLSTIRNYLHNNVSYDIIKLALAQIHKES